MKKITGALLLAFTMLFLSSCFLFGKVSKFPDMVEYTEEEILEAAKQKYGVAEWIFTDAEIMGEALYDAEGAFKLTFYNEQFSTEFLNGHNVAVAMQAFAGKNGDHDIQGRFAHFLCYVALGKCTDGSLKFIYYNTNIHKDAKISDTIGASDYTFEVLPTEIQNDLFSAPSNWGDMSIYLKQYEDLNPRGFIYSGKHLTVMRHERYGGITYIELYKENGEIVYDLYHDKNEYDNKDDRQLIYSTSERYGVIYNYYGADKSQYFSITQSVTQSTEQESCMVLEGCVKPKDIGGTVIYSKISYFTEYQVERDGKITTYSGSTETVKNDLDFSYRCMINKIDSVNHAETAKFIVSDFYIFYEKG